MLTSMGISRIDYNEFLIIFDKLNASSASKKNALRNRIKFLHINKDK